ncbi:MAG: NADH-quinone oxidoreductase subunit NuoH [Candidatus Marinimicrobia bacterium]|nr:NADH-quinone oxidoreductase subunit NuoH [Candidatus Neomarinimicrobiota bacterium]
MDYFIQIVTDLLPGLNGLPQWLVIPSIMFLFGALIFTGIAIYSLIILWFERKIAAHMQDRLGPMEVGGWHGWLQTVADAVKLLLKEDIIPAVADRKLFKLAPYIVFLAAFAVFAALPFSDKIIGSELNIGIFYILAVSSIGVVGILMAGWGSNNKWALFGSMRSVAQLVSYEVPIGLSILVVVMSVGSLSMRDIVMAQDGGIFNWMIWQNAPFNFIAFLILFIAGTAETNRVPFDIPEAESELVAGFHVEYSGMRFSIFFLAEYANMLAVGIIASTLFLGGWQGITGASSTPGIGLIWMLLKGFLIVLVMIWFRWTLPRLRVDQLMYVCWKVLVPISFLNMVGAGIWIGLSS